MTPGPFISIIVPVFNGGKLLGLCLEALLRSGYPDYEIIVVDDASTDRSERTANAFGTQVVQLSQKSGPAAARNAGARIARGEILLFVDADVQVRPDTLNRVAAKFLERPDVAAIFGSYDDRPYSQTFISQYKNLYHHFIHQQGDTDASTFWTGCGAVRRRAFEATGGFDESFWSIEDIEFGYRLRDLGFPVLLDKTLQVKHLKNWTLASLLRSDIFDRAIPWSRLILETGHMNNDLNLRQNYKISSVLVGSLITLLPLAFFLPLVVHLELFLLLALLVLNYDLYAFFLKRKGLPFTFLSILLHFFYYFYSGVVFMLIWAGFALRRNLARCIRAIGWNEEDFY